MRITQLIKKYVVPQFSSINYNLTSKFPNGVFFSNTDETVDIMLSWTNRCPVELFDTYMKMIKCAGPNPPPHALTIKYKIAETYRYRSIEPHHLSLGVPLDSAFFYFDEDSFIIAANKLTKQSLEIVCPYLEMVAEQAIFLKDAPYHLLKDGPQERAKRFASQYSLPMKGDRSIIQSHIDTTFLKLLPEKHSDRKKRFFDISDDIADFAAYCGEMILQYYPDGSWETFPAQPYVEEVLRYGICVDDDSSQDILWDIVTSWNLSPQVEHVGLHSPYFLEKFNSDTFLKW